MHVRDSLNHRGCDVAVLFDMDRWGEVGIFSGPFLDPTGTQANAKIVDQSEHIESLGIFLKAA